MWFSEKVTFSLPCLKSLVNSDNACVNCKTNFKRTLVLSPVHLNDLKQSVREILMSKVTTYDIELGGIILSHKNIKICNSVEMNDAGYFNLDYVADIYIFTPQIGSILSGRINKKGRDVLTCLVHSIFHVALPNIKSEEDDNSKKWIGKRAYIGQNVTFSVVKLDFTGKLPYIRGQILSLENDGMGEEEGVDSGMGGLIESNDDDSSMKDVNEQDTPRFDRETSIKNKKRKHQSDSLTETTKAKRKKKVKNNSSDEGVSGEESLLYSQKIKKEKFSPEVKVKEEPLKETNSELNSFTKPKKRKREKRNSVSSISSGDIDSISSSLLAEALEKTKIKVENTSLDAEKYVDNSTIESGSSSLIQKELKMKKKSSEISSVNVKNLSQSLLKEAYNSISETSKDKTLSNSDKDESYEENVKKNKTKNHQLDKNETVSVLKAKKKKKNSDLDGISSALIKQAIKNTSAKMESIEEKNDDSIQIGKTQSKKQTFTESKNEMEFDLETIKRNLLQETIQTKSKSSKSDGSSVKMAKYRQSTIESTFEKARKKGKD